MVGIWLEVPPSSFSPVVLVISVSFYFFLVFVKIAKVLPPLYVQGVVFCKTITETFANLSPCGYVLLSFFLPIGMTKEERLRSGESLMSHAMVFTGYDKRDGENIPNKWRVENR